MRVESLNTIRKSHIQEVMRHAKGDLELASRILDVTIEELRQLLMTHDLNAADGADGPPATKEEN